MGGLSYRLEEWQKSIPLNALECWMDSEGLGRGPIQRAELLKGGTQNLLLLFTRSERTYVLRRPPPVLRSDSNRAMLREGQILGALAGSSVPHPALIALCTDENVLGSVFFLMEPVAGFNATTELPALHRESRDVRKAMGMAVVDAAIALSQIDPFQPALSGLGDPDRFLERQVERWRSQLASYDKYPEWPGTGELPGVDVITEFLASEVPSASYRPGLMHGDYHMANVMFRNDGPEVAAIVDWELSTIGDPLLDFAWLLATWRGPPEDDVDLIDVRPFDGFPEPGELIDYYAALTGRDLSNLDWYVILACYKLAIIIEGTFARASAGHAPKDTGERLHRSAQQLLQRALRRIEKRG
jgi:aminoglycoside phosphotransferase (APT) family kinase protein